MQAEAASQELRFVSGHDLVVPSLPKILRALAPEALVFVYGTTKHFAEKLFLESRRDV
jgi:hypothetical protein